MNAPVTTPVSAPRWVEVLSHLDPRYGGLSSAVPALAASLATGLGGTPFRMELAAFCAQDEQFVPDSFRAGECLRFWPASRAAWLRDRLRSGVLRQQFTESLRDAAGLHLHGLWEVSTAVAASAARRLGIPYVLSAHGMLEPWALRQRRRRKQLYAAILERPNVRAARAIHALTPAEAQQFAAFGARCPVAVIPNPVDVPAGATPGPFLNAFPQLCGTRIVLFCGRLHPKKGLDLLLAAWMRAAGDRHPEARLVLAGPDLEGTRARLEKMVAAHGLGKSVLFPGMLHAALKWSALAAAEAAVLPSRSEGLSMSVLEGMGMGLPVLITHGCNMPEIATQGCGWVVEPEVESLRMALTQLLGNSSAENAELGANGRRLVAARFSPGVVARQMAELYTWAAGGPRPASLELQEPGAVTARRFPGTAPSPVREVCR